MVRSPTPFGLNRNGCLTFRGSQLPWALPFIFSLCCPLNNRSRAAHSFLKISPLFSLSLFSCPSLALFCLFLLLFLLMSGNVYPNPSSIFPCSVCGENVTWRGKSVQYCIFTKWVHLRCSKPSFSKFRALDSSHSWSFPRALFLLVTLGLSPRTPPTCIPPLYNLAPSTNAALPHHPRLQTSYSLSAHSVSSPSASSPPSVAPGCPSTPPLPLTLSGFFNGMLEIFEPGALNYFIFSLPILLTLSVSSNPILTHFPLSGFLDSLLCVLIALTPSLVFSFLMPRTLATMSFSSPVFHWIRIVKLLTQHVKEATLGYPPITVRLVGGGATSRCWGYFHNWFEMGCHFFLA